jgi:hypothetical protein
MRAPAGRPPVLRSHTAAPSRDPLRRVVLALLGILTVGGIAAVLLILTSGGGGKTAAGGSARTTNSPASARTGRAVSFDPSTVIVAVLNGTATPGLAHRVALQLAADRYKEGTIATASDQTRTATVVSYMPAHRADALHVAASLKLTPASVQPIDQSTQAVACPPPSACAATVVVTVGTDLASAR